MCLHLNAELYCGKAQTLSCVPSPRPGAHAGSRRHTAANPYNFQPYKTTAKQTKAIAGREQIKSLPCSLLLFSAVMPLRLVPTT